MSKKEKQGKKNSKKQKKDNKPVILMSFDGTVMDTEPAILATYRHLFAMYDRGSEFTRDIGVEVLDSRLDAMIRKYFPDQDVNKLVNEYRSYQNNHLRDLIQPMKGSVAFLEWLKSEGFVTGIVSTRDRRSVVDLLEHTNMAQYIDVVIGNAGAGTEKMNSDAIITACAVMKAKFCVFIADGANDIEAGREAGVLCIGYCSNRDKARTLLESHPDFLTADFREIRKLIDTEPLWMAYPLTSEKIEDDSEE